MKICLMAATYFTNDLSSSDPSIGFRRYQHLISCVTVVDHGRKGAVMKYPTKFSQSSPMSWSNKRPIHRCTLLSIPDLPGVPRGRWKVLPMANDINKVDHWANIWVQHHLWLPFLTNVTLKLAAFSRVNRGGLCYYLHTLIIPGVLFLFGTYS